jgi:dihydrofolate reductase
MVSIVLAIDAHGLIGRNNDLPWHYSEDLKYFKNLTSGHTVLMGRKTFDSIVNRLGHPLPNRKNLVATRKKKTIEGAEVIHDLEQYLRENKDQDIYIIGGKEIFQIALPYVDCMYITHIKHLYEGDTYMQIDYHEYKMNIIRETEDLIFCKYERIQQ